MRIISSIGPSVGYDHGSPVSARYEAPFPFEGVLDRVEIQVMSSGGAAVDEIAAADARQSMSRQ